MEFIYSGNSKSGGTYKITNKTNNRIYIGSCKGFKQRWSQHAKQLQNGKHSNTFLLNDFKKSGSDAFVFEVLEVILGPKEERLAAEQKLLSIHYDQQVQCYNLCDKAISRENKKNKNPEETRAKKSAKSKEMWASPGFKEATREAIRQGTMKPESRKLRSQVMKEIWENPQHREKVVAHRHRFDLKKQFMKNCHTPESIEKSRQARKRFYGKVMSPSGEIYEVWSLTEFCLEHGLSKKSIGNFGKLMKGRYSQLFGWKLVLPETAA